MWKEVQEDAQFENSQMIDNKSIVINLEWNAGQRTILKSETDKMAIWLQTIRKKMQDNAKF